MNATTIALLKDAPVWWWANLTQDAIDYLVEYVGQDVIVDHRREGWRGAFRMRRPDDGAWLHGKVPVYMLLDTRPTKCAII